MSDFHTEVTSEGWGSRLMGSIKSVGIGLVMFLAAFPVLFWNEGRAVRTAKSLEEGAGAVVSVAAERVEPGNQGKLIHVTGVTATDEVLADEEFGVKAPAIKLVRQVEMYQWTEEKSSKKRDKLGGGTETVTTYEYKKAWSKDQVDSGDFKKPDGHQNPSSMPFESRTILARKVQVGAFELGDSQVSELDKTEDLTVDPARASALRSAVGKAKVQNGAFYIGADPASPAIGDLRVRFKVVKPGPVTIVARQVASSFEAYPTQAGNPLLIVKEGTFSADAVFKAEQQANKTFTWILRGVGFFIMFLGITMVFRPLVVFADVIPFLGSLLGAGVALFAGLVAAALSLATIAVAWLYYRPLFAIGLLVLAAAAITALIMLARKAMARRQAAAA